MGNKNAFLKMQEEKRIQRDTVVLGWGVQSVFDALTLVLNDPDYMGKDVFGEKRLKKLNTALDEVTREIIDGMTKTNVGASHQRRLVDDRLQKIMKENFAPWTDRYIGWDDRGI